LGGVIVPLLNGPSTADSGESKRPQLKSMLDAAARREFVLLLF